MAVKGGPSRKKCTRIYGPRNEGGTNLTEEAAALAPIEMGDAARGLRSLGVLSRSYCHDS